jgi:hypothetical protein
MDLADAKFTREMTQGLANILAVLLILVSAPFALLELGIRAICKYISENG